MDNYVKSLVYINKLSTMYIPKMWITCGQLVHNYLAESYPQVIHNLSTGYPQVIHILTYWLRWEAYKDWRALF